MTELKLGESVAVLGVGPVGQSCIAFASLSGAGELIAIGAPNDRLEFARRMGATATLSLGTPPQERLESVRRLTNGRGVDAVIEASGAPEAVKQALDLVRDGGRVIVCGQYTDNGTIDIHPHWQLNRKHIEVKGCWGSRYDHFHRAAALTARYGERKPWREMVRDTFGLSSANAALRAVEDRTAIKAVITPNPALVRARAV
jgi:L-iditol 2-dehydrogenase